MTAPVRTLAGRYRLVQRLGAGGMGVVWRARDELIGRDVAVKELLLPDHLSAEQRDYAAQRALREARAAALLQHRSIVTVHDVVLDEGRPCIVMDLLPGRSLDAVLTDDGPLPPDRVARIGLEILGALRAAHAQGILHRDVKPANIFLREDGAAVLTDFGIAALEGEATLTQPGSLIGSPSYMAPERARHDMGGPASDLWSLGATLYALTEGRSPFARSTVMGTLGAVLADEPDPPTAAGPLAPLLVRLLVKDPEARISAEETEAYLRALVAGERTAPLPSAPPPTPHSANAAHPTVPAHAPKPRRSCFLPVLAATVVTAALIATIVIIVARGQDDPASPAPRARASTGTVEPTPFTSAPAPCGLISAEQAAQLVRTFHNHGDESPDSSTGRPRKNCVWQTSALADGDERLTLALRTTDTAEEARQLLAEEQANATERTTPLPDLSDAAFATSGPNGDSLIWFHVDNLVAEIQYGTDRGQQGQLARQAAQWTRNALEHP
ncbi:serine/threonine protein kinase [Mycobacterium tuberculosis]|nr:serine/threonine protein kinase [Mycobacterium tuberculosis]